MKFMGYNTINMSMRCGRTTCGVWLRGCVSGVVADELSNGFVKSLSI